MAVFIRNPTDRIAVIIAAVALGLCLGAAGAYFTFSVSPDVAAEIEHIRNMPHLDGEGFEATPPDQEVVITGRLEGNEELTDTGFVGYVVETLTVETSRIPLGTSRYGNTSKYGSWSRSWVSLPALAISLESGTATTAEMGPRAAVRFGGDLLEVVGPNDAPPTSPTRANSSERVRHVRAALPTVT